MDKALDMLNRLIGIGWEFPDAAYKAAIEMNVNQGKLEEAYDSQYA